MSLSGEEKGGQCGRTQHFNVVMPAVGGAEGGIEIHENRKVGSDQSTKGQEALLGSFDCLMVSETLKYSS